MIAQDDAEEKGVGGLGGEVPAFDGPAHAGPPLAAEAPWPVEALDLIAATFIPEGKDGLALQLHFDCGAGTKPAQSGGVLQAARGGKGCWRSQGELPHEEGIVLVGVLEDGLADAILSNDGGQTGECDLEQHGFGQLRGEEAELHLAGAAGICRETQSQYASCRRMGFEIKLQQLQKDGSIDGRQSWLESAAMRRGAIEGAEDSDGGERQRMDRGPQDKLREHRVEDEEQGIDGFDRAVELDELFQDEGSREGLKVMRRLAAGKLVKSLALLTKASDEIYFGQPGEVTEGLDAPLRESDGLIFAEVQHTQGKRREDGGFRSRRGMGKRGVAGAREAERSMEVRARCDPRSKAEVMDVGANASHGGGD